MRVDIAGAGIIGLSIAWRLAQAGYEVTVRDAGRAAGQASWAGAGMLAPAGEFRSESRWTQLAIESLAAYGAFVEELTAATGVAIDYRVTGALELALNDAEKEALDRPRPEGIRMEEVTVAGARYFAPIAMSGVRAARWFPNEAVVDPRQVCAALLAACKGLGVEIRENEPVAECRGPMVVAAGAWTSRITGLESEPRSFPVKGHLLGYHCKKESMPPIVRHGHHYALQRDNGFTIFGSDEQRDAWDATPDAERVGALIEAAAALLPRLLQRPPDEVWAGLRPGSDAGEPVVEQMAGRDIWLAYGHYRNGILLAPVTARMITESIVARLGKGR
jgi:glycine oxidase